MVPRADPLRIDPALLRQAFSARRKTLRNALRGVDFERARVDPALRPENLSPEDYARLSACAR
jgi:16S rRNA A1518/A1519 N6-dimethyltransferase RsmA/KsgA/DIM1 with predicted DNA glycosylase/AP lyase activity